jgi:hypothetical protein
MDHAHKDVGTAGPEKPDAFWHQRSHAGSLQYGINAIWDPIQDLFPALIVLRRTAVNGTASENTHLSQALLQNVHAQQMRHTSIA